MEISLEGIIKKAEPRHLPGDYYKNDLLYCGKCHTPKQCRIDVGRVVIVGCMCECEEQEAKRQAEEQRRMEEADRIRTLRAEGIQDKQIACCTFADANDTELIRKCRKYVERWKEMKEINAGLLFYGNVGAGKTFAAGCIANALIDKGVPVMVTSLPRIINSGWERSEIIGQLKRYPLLILDDFGVERKSEFALETVYNVIDERYKAQKPLIVTTNVPLSEMKNPSNVEFGRIYSRVLEMCVPVKFDGENRRVNRAAEKIKAVKSIFAD